MKEKLQILGIGIAQRCECFLDGGKRSFGLGKLNIRHPP